MHMKGKKCTLEQAKKKRGGRGEGKGVKDQKFTENSQ